MKRAIFILIFSAAAIAVAAGVFFFFRESDEKKIKSTLNELCVIGSKSSGENPAFLALKANRADKVFAPKCSFDFKLHIMDGVITPTEIGAKILRFQALFNNVKLDFSELEIAIDGDKAAVFFTGSLRGVLKSNGDKVDELKEIEALLERQESGEWKFSRMSFKNILEK